MFIFCQALTIKVYFGKYHLQFLLAYRLQVQIIMQDRLASRIYFHKVGGNVLLTI